VGGNTVEIRDKRVFINGIPLFEPYKVHKEERIIPGYDLKSVDPKLYQKLWEERKFLNDPQIRDNFGPIRVPAGYLFMMGDNSFDS